MGIINCIINTDWSCVTDWSISNVVWWLLQFVIIGVLVELIVPFIAAIFLTKKILKNNRVGEGRGYGTKAADLFVDLWRSDKKYDNTISQCIAGGSTTLHRTLLVGKIVDEHLALPKLAEVFEEHATRVKKVRAIKNFRNRIVYWFVIRGLIHKYDDNPNSYRS